MGDICIFGQGYVGLPLALSFSLKGCKVTGIDVDEFLVNDINRGKTHLKEEYKGKRIEEILKEQLENGNYRAATAALDAVKNSSCIIITVGIPVNKGRLTLKPLEQCCRTIGRGLKKGTLVLVRSTLIPGTTEEFIIPVLQEESGMVSGEDFFTAYAPERIAEGRAFQEFEDMPALAGAPDRKSLDKALELLNIVCLGGIITGSSIKAVEASKLFENVQRDVNIALSQELARYSEASGLDIFEIIKMANTHSRVNLMVPGPGVGGYCIPNAYNYLAAKSSELNIDLELMGLARKKNQQMPEFILAKARDMLSAKGKDLKQSKAAVVGLAMKDYSSDHRLSPALDICRLLVKNDVKVAAYDPEITLNVPFKLDNLNDTLKDADVVFILARQSSIDFSTVEKWLLDIGSSAVCLDLKAGICNESLIKDNQRYWRI